MSFIIWTLLALQQLATAQAIPPAPAPLEREAWVMGTRLRVVIDAAGHRAESAVAESALREVERVDALLSTWDPATPLSRLNRTRPGTWVPVERELAGLLREIHDWTARTGRAFDARVGSLVDAWGTRGPTRTPSEEQLRVALAASGPGGFLLEEDRLLRLTEQAWIDAGAFGKGAGLRSAARHLSTVSSGAGDRVLIELGGQVLALAPRDAPWSVAVAHPRRRSDAVATLRVSDRSVATSGTSERGRHIFDPRSGRQVEPWGSVTVVHGDPLASDVLSTALFVMGPDEGFAWADREGVAALFLECVGGEVAARWTDALDPWLVQLPTTSGAPCSDDERSTS